MASVPQPRKLPVEATPRLPAQSTPTSALYNFRLLAALRSDDPTQVQQFLDELKAGPNADGAEAEAERAGRLLGMAVRVASVPIIQQLLSSPLITSPNLPVERDSKTTPLHFASEYGRADAVQILLAHPMINDTLRDDQGRTALECAATPEVAALIEDSRTTLQTRYLAQLTSYVSSPLSSPEGSTAMVQFLEGPRTEILNLSAFDEKSGTTLLHEAARRRDLRLVELAVQRGADVFVRDKKGRRVLEGEKAPDERVKAFLRQFNNQESLVQVKSDGRPPDLKGFLSKWVNYRSGWRTRWFVLENGILSYYRNREDEPVACRGSVSMAIATISPSNDNSRFELHSRVSSAVPKIIVKSAHRGEVARWIQAVKLNIEYYSKNPGQAGAAAPKRGASLNVNPERATTTASTVNSMPPTDSFLDPKLGRTTTGLSIPSIKRAMTFRSSRRREPSPAGTEGTDADTISITEAADDGSIIGDGDGHGSGLPHETEFDMAVINIKTQLELTEQLVSSIVTPPASSTASPERSGQLMTRTPSRQVAVKEALKSSLSMLSILVSQQNVMTKDRERYLLGRIQREVEARKLWEENMLAVAQQQADMDRQLTEAARTNEKKRRALKQAKEVLAGITAAGSLPTSPMPDSALSPTEGILDVPPSAASSFATAATAASLSSFPTPALRGHRQSVSITNVQEVHAALQDADSDEDEGDDEFFDAIETNQLPNMKQHEAIAHPEKDRPGTPTQTPRTEPKAFKLDMPSVVASTLSAVTRATMPTPPAGATIKDYLARKSLEPYLQVRHRLPIDDDKRPSVSLWSILKSSVGKDLTKISFPVSFNECTSMLQRMAEDMEYDACLTVAAGEEDSFKRLAFVGAFAMSNYSSTIGRIAKPFNPLLSQSFEYAIPGRYRYISEQVSHHPPISACYSEAPTWKYFGEVDAQNKFQGRSFEIRPTGVAHAELIIPRKWVGKGLEYPAAGKEYGEGLVVEHYSWKKVTTNVSNFIMGTPIIDHYGDLVVTNHRTGDTCTLTFKPRGWRSKDAMEIKGSVVDSGGKTVWDIAGRWDSQLIARKAGVGSSPLDVDTQFSQSQKEYLLLWRKSENPPAPFNLTPFAITLNDIPSGLKRYLAPTDCRLRTDQRAFENAEYDRAQELKTANEEKQRITRKLRSEGKLSPHEPRWFTSSTDPDGGERLWEPRRADDGEVLFWHMRETAPDAWKEVDHIFVED